MGHVYSLLFGGKKEAVAGEDAKATNAEVKVKVKPGEKRKREEEGEEDEDEEEKKKKKFDEAVELRRGPKPC